MRVTKHSFAKHIIGTDNVVRT